MINTKVDIDGTTYTDHTRLFVTTAMEKNIATGNFSVEFPSPFGRHKDSFTIGTDIVIYAAKDSPIETPIAQWRMNDNLATTAVVDSVGTNTGTAANNTSTMSVTGKINEALEFVSTNSDYVTASPNEDLSNFTIAMWVKPSYSALQFWFSMQDASSQRLRIFQASSTDIEIDGYPGEIGNKHVTVTDGVWQHLVVTYDGTGIRAYINGVESGTKTAAVLGQTNITNFTLGRNSTADQYYFNGSMDDVRIYDKVLDITEIERIYNEGTGTENYISNSDNKLFTGIVEKVKFEGRENTQQVILTGRDYSARLQDVTAQPSVYTDSEVSTIVKDIITQYVKNITTTNVNVTDTTLSRISFNHKSVYDSFTQLAELAGYYFYVDADKDLHFEILKNENSGITLNNTNIIKTTFNKTREGMANQVWVYGDRTLAGFKENFSGDGGSVFSVVNKPQNVYVEVDEVPQKGGIWNLNLLPPSGTNYLIDYQDQEIIFISGTANGDSVPTSGTSTDIDVTYDREVPIVKFARDSDSIGLYGLKEKIIVDRNIRDPQTANDTILKAIQDSSPFKGLEIETKGWWSINPGDTISATLSDFNLAETDLDILGINYTFNDRTTTSEKVIRFKVDKKVQDITDKIGDHEARLRRLEAPDLSTAEILTRYETETGELSITGSIWKVSTRELTGSAGIWNHPTYGIWDGSLWGPSTGTYTSYTIIASGGEV